ncbi:caspase-1-like [Sorex fumeus]|uniref:caspase-1-like n=1 Tax=Sorex fumeus TaxID=62283 RepID=UPI0024AE6508|nr:caspase-1-like [Sorex fumeus]
MADKILRQKSHTFILSVSKITLYGLLDQLFAKEVLNLEERNLVIGGNTTSMEMARELIHNILLKGPDACQIFIDYICEQDTSLAKTLGLSLASLMVQVTDDIKSCEPETTLKLCSLDFVQEMQQQKVSECCIYPIKEKSGQRTRLALIICNMEFEHLPKRTGADIDVKGMRKLLQDLGYSVEVKENLTSSDMVMELKAFAARPEHVSSDSTFVVFMSHGLREGICGKRHSETSPDILDVDQIFRSLNTPNCPNLRDKPKVIIIQACRGGREGATWVKDSAEEDSGNSRLTLEDFEEDAIRKVHEEKDFIAFCSSTPNHYSWRSPEKGSLFITKLIEKLKEYACSYHLEDIFREVRFSFELPATRLQMPTTERVTLTKPFYLFPGY